MSKASVFDGPTVGLEDMLQAREGRSFRQKSLMDKYPQASLLCATMNIPGPVKKSEKLGLAFTLIIDRVKKELADHILFDKAISPQTGWEYYMVSDLSALELKKRLIDIEESSDLGRLIDLDVIEKSDSDLLRPISRTELGKSPRKCFVCSEIAKECGRSRKHSVEQMQDVISQMIDKALDSCLEETS
ncbi:citrate lyase holo-[acyl-carrier protein] synthase [Streptococcus pluranimalium]|uniref:citrate lyase holo-[acyl-carrier protein] synthase n=1 Tax=Streptococcus pluranimalium TaxID=82348 RepID=UPI0039FD365C